MPGSGLNPAINLRADPGLRAAARQVALLRLLLLALALAAVALVRSGDHVDRIQQVRPQLVALLGVVCTVAALFAATVRATRWRWQVELQLLFDMLWCGALIHYTGGVESPAVVLLFTVVLVGNLVLPGVAPFVTPAVAALALAASALLDLAGYASGGSPITANRALGILALQAGALFVVDLLGQLLARRLREQQIFTDELIDQLGEGVIAVDRGGMIAYANEEALRLFGLVDRELRGMRAEAVFADARWAELRSLLVGATPALARMAGPDGRQLVVRVKELVGRRGKPIGRTLVVADETRLRVLEDSAHRSERLAALGAMAAGIAHEVRNPLTSLRGCAQELAEISTSEGNRDAADLARILVSESDRLARIVEDFLSLSRMRPPQREAVDLARLLADLRRQYEHAPGLPPGLTLSVSSEPGCPPAFADPDQLRQVLTNLIANALDALRATGMPRLEIHAERAPPGNALGVDGVRIVVRDNGPGVPAELRERVFTPFFSTKSTGTGLGLSLVQRIVREHDGLISLDVAPGGGTAVVLLLPAHSQTRVFVRALGGR